jgi:hypothetical protein
VALTVRGAFQDGLGDEIQRAVSEALWAMIHDRDWPISDGQMRQAVLEVIWTAQYALLDRAFVLTGLQWTEEASKRFLRKVCGLELETTCGSGRARTMRRCTVPAAAIRTVIS